MLALDLMMFLAIGLAAGRVAGQIRPGVRFGVVGVLGAALGGFCFNGQARLSAMGCSAVWSSRPLARWPCCSGCV